MSRGHGAALLGSRSKSGVITKVIQSRSSNVVMGELHALTHPDFDPVVDQEFLQIPEWREIKTSRTESSDRRMDQPRQDFDRSVSQASPGPQTHRVGTGASPE